MSPNISEDDLKQVLEGFSEYPIRYAEKGALGLVSNYWDIAAAVLGEFAFCDTNSAIFGEELRTGLMLGMPILSLAGAKGSLERLGRNVGAYCAPLFYFWNRGIEGVPETTVLLNKIAGGVMAGTSLAFDYFYRREKREGKNKG